MNLSKLAVTALATTAIAGTSAEATVLANPTVTGSGTAFGAGFEASNLFEGTTAEYASAGAGAVSAPFSTSDGTWVEMDFGSAVNMDRFLLVTRTNSVDVVGESRLILSSDATFDGTDTIITFDPTGANGQGLIQNIGTNTARYARWEVTTSTGGSQNLGGIEMRFLNTPSGSFVAPVTVIGGATAFSPAYALENAANGDAGRDASGVSGIEYASAGLGADMFVDFDFGSVTPITGFDFFDRIGDRTTEFDLIFSNDSDFSTEVATLSFAPGATGWGYSENFAEINAQYVRLDATAFSGGVNTGIQDIVFYAVPEPSSLALLGLGGLLIARRRRA